MAATGGGDEGMEHDAAAAEAAFSLQTLAAITTAVLFWKVSKVRTDTGRGPGGVQELMEVLVGRR
jgi:hypothetical protein